MPPRAILTSSWLIWSPMPPGSAEVNGQVCLVRDACCGSVLWMPLGPGLALGFSNIAYAPVTTMYDYTI